MAKGKVKGFLKKHSFIVVFIVALVIAVANYLVYPMFISKDMKLLNVPIAKESIPEGTLITEEMLSSVSIASDMLPKGVYIDPSAVTGKYVRANSTIPANGLFYVESLCDTETALGGYYKELESGEWAYTMEVSPVYDQKDNLKEGQYVNVYFSCEAEVPTEDGEDTIPNAVVFGMLKENVRILSKVSNEDSRLVTYALTEEDIAYFEIAKHLAKTYKGEVYPLVYYSSDSDSIKTRFYDVDSLRIWLKERSKVMEYPEIIRNMDKATSGSAVTVEILSDGGSILD